MRRILIEKEYIDPKGCSYGFPWKHDTICYNFHAPEECVSADSIGDIVNGDRSQIYIKYDRDKLLAIQLKYSLGYDFMSSAVLYAENVISFLKGDDELLITGEDLLYRFFFNVYKGKARLHDRRRS